MGISRRDCIAGLVAAPWVATAAGTSPIGSRLALVDLPLIEGGSFRAAEADRMVTVLYWWASWCPFCAEMSPSIEQLWRRQRERGLAVLGLSIDRTVEPAREYRRRKGYTFPSAWVGSEAARALPKAAKIPMLWVRDRQGRVVMAETGQLFPEDVEQVARFL